MAIGKNILEYVQQKLCCQIISSAPVGGGSINQAYCANLKRKIFYQTQ